jgi:hypothetical protein
MHNQKAVEIWLISYYYTTLHSSADDKIRYMEQVKKFPPHTALTRIWTLSHPKGVGDVGSLGGNILAWRLCNDGIAVDSPLGCASYWSLLHVNAHLGYHAKQHIPIRGPRSTSGPRQLVTRRANLFMNLLLVTTSLVYFHHFEGFKNCDSCFICCFMYACYLTLKPYHKM